ncbi:TetR/AcrR family transcriptional regulator [Hyphomonas sp.]|uniref:TetR/AcrR family transcriptional regulator n=1 Tax=Hyphomonas sp. TaxID=87 RepID=UPI001BCE2C7D|nr:TetR/AcrR family transcriptional regulator [Hyphomonas sp.]
MKTRDRILQVSLLLFNEEGEAQLSSVDVANALEISPGNLYYHFKGKDAIIRALYDRFEEEMHIILRGSSGGVASIEDNWVYIYILLEEIYDFRFFYRDVAGLLDRYPDLAGRFRGLIAEKRQTILRILDDLTRLGVIDIDPRLKPPLTDQVITTLTFWLAGDTLSRETHDGPALIHNTVFQVMCLIVPYMGAGGPAALSGMIRHFKEAKS